MRDIIIMSDYFKARYLFCECKIQECIVTKLTALNVYSAASDLFTLGASHSNCNVF